MHYPKNAAKIKVGLKIIILLRILLIFCKTKYNCTFILLTSSDWKLIPKMGKEDESALPEIVFSDGGLLELVNGKS